ncbi:MAG: Crp/Fnr family transcriptional regulator [Xanthobacteraceae bacterium]|jgi:CRP/FNR family transcriptional regulator, cyclic AMP receptor protein
MAPDLSLANSLSTAADLPPELDDSLSRQAALSTALGSVFRGRFCDLLLANRKTTTFSKHSVIYNVGDRERRFFFLQNGFAKVGTITADGREIIYDVRKGGDVIGELCASEEVRPDRAVALEQTDAVSVPFEEVMQHLLKQPELIAVLVDVFCRALKEAYAQVNSLAIDDTVNRLIKVLIGLATKIGRPTGSVIEIPTYLTQEEISQMAAARRERVSTALNILRRRGMVQYSARGHMMLDVGALESYSA